jgi:hypothetical protein
LIINRMKERNHQHREKIILRYVVHRAPVMRLFIGDCAILVELLRHGQDLELQRRVGNIGDEEGILLQINTPSVACARIRLSPCG